MEAFVRRLAMWKKVALLGVLGAFGVAVPTVLYVAQELAGG